MWLTFFSPYECLDEEFDADIEADYELCCAVASGRWGLHPDAWDNYDPLTVGPPHVRRPREVQPYKYKAAPVNPAWEAQHRRPPVVPTSVWLETRPAGEVQLTCDWCKAARFSVTMEYREGRRDAAVAAIRRLGAEHGWTCIAGMDRCPRCSHAAAPEAVGDGAGEHQRNKQHAERG